MEKECWFNLGSLVDPTQPGTDSDRFIVARTRGRRNDDGNDDVKLPELRRDGKPPELRDDGKPEGTKTTGPADQRKRATPNIPAPTAQQTNGPADAFINCPVDNRTVYTEPVTAKRYVILCGRDYSSEFGAYDIRSLTSPNTNDCIARCAADKSGCTAVGWGDYRGAFTCFMKRSIGDPNYAPAWRVAVEDPSQRGTGASPQPQLATDAAAAQNGGAGGLSGDAKAGIGVGAAIGVILIGAGAVAVWYFEQRRQLRQRAREVEERKLEAASGSTDGGGGGGGGGPSSSRVGPPTRGSSYRSNRQHAAAVAAPANSEGRGSGSGDATAGTRNPEPAGSIRSTSTGSGARGAAAASEGVEGTEETPPGLAHVSSYLRQQQQLILDSCKQQQQQQPAPTTTPPPPPLQKPERAWTGPVGNSGGSNAADNTPTGHESLVSPWSATAGPGPGPASASASASELPVREGYQGYGPEYEMPSGAEPGGQPPRPHRAAPLWGADAAEQKFLLADMAGMKKRVLLDDRTELP